MRLPLLWFLLAKAGHAPNAVGVYELGWCGMPWRLSPS